MNTICDLINRPAGGFISLWTRVVVRWHFMK